MDVGVIGTGYMGKNHARVYSELKSVDSVYIYDANKKVADELALQYNLESCQSLDTLLKNVDCVSICVPTQFHAQTAQKVFDAHVSCLIEKPICLNSREAELLMKTAPKDIIIGVGHIEYFNPIVKEIFNIAKDPLYIEIKRHNPTSRIIDTGVVEDLMIHDIDIILSMLKTNPIDVYSVHNSDICNVIMKFPNSITVALSASRKSSKKIRSIYIEEQDFTIDGDFINQELTIYKKPDCVVTNQKYIHSNVIERVVVNKTEPLREELLTFMDCVKNNKPFPISPERAIKDLKLCERICDGVI
jgi:predicted dehydrogenase